MRIWHESLNSQFAWAVQRREGRVVAIIRPTDQGKYEIYFMRWNRDSHPLSQIIAPDGWMELWPREKIIADTPEEAKKLAHFLLEQLEAGFIDDDYFEKRQYKVVRPERIKEIVHDVAKAKAIIYLHPDGRYEVRYFVYEPVAQSLDGTKFEWDWIRTRWDKATFADNLRSAEEVAKLELEQIVKELEVKAD